MPSLPIGLAVPAEARLNSKQLRTLMSAAAYQARRMARTLRLSPADREDAEQDLLLALLERSRFFDPSRGAWTPFIDRLARQATQSIADDIVAFRSRQGISLEEAVGESAAADGEPATIADCLGDNTALAETDILGILALIIFIGQLPAMLRPVAEAALRADGDLADARRKLNLSPSEFYRRLRELRYRMFTVCLVDRRSLPDRRRAYTVPDSC